MIKKVTFIKKCLYGNKGETRDVTTGAAHMYLKLGLIEPFEVTEVKEVAEVKEEKESFETKEEKKIFKAKPVKLTKSPKPL